MKRQIFWGLGLNPVLTEPAGIAPPRRSPASCEKIFAPPSESQNREILAREKWFHSALSENVKRAIRVQVAWTHFLRNGLQLHERIFWIQQGLLKDLNEKLWDLGGTEFYLGSLDQTLSDQLRRNPELGRIIHRNYKDRVVISSLSTEDFERLVLHPVQKQLEEKILALQSDAVFLKDPHFQWRKFIQQSISLGTGKSLETSYLNLKLSAQGESFSDWKKKTEALRIALTQKTSTLGLSWEEVLLHAQKLKTASPEFHSWSEKRGLNTSDVQNIDSYLERLKVVDFLPLHEPLKAHEIPEIRRLLQKSMVAPQKYSDLRSTPKLVAGAWDFSRSLFLEEALDSHHILATDIQGLGGQALLARDAWIQEGAPLDQLSRVYEGTTQDLKKFYSEIASELQRLLSLEKAPVSYVSGDDGLWALPPMNATQWEALLNFLKRTPRLYAHIESNQKPGDFESLGHTIYRAREKLFAQKPATKALSESQ